SEIAGEKGEGLNSIFGRPDECLEEVAVGVIRRTGKAHNIAALINIRRRIPKRRAEIAKIDNFAIVPTQRVFRRVSADGLIANSGNADGLTLLVNRGRSTGSIAGE